MIADLLTLAVALAGCLLLYVYFSSGVCLGAGARRAVPERFLVAMYGRAGAADARWPAGAVVLCALLAVATQVMSLALLAAGGEGSYAPAVIVLVGGELLATFGWTGYVALRVVAR